jgi:hypothetical protein
MLDCVPPRTFIPPELKGGPFTVAQGRQAGLERWHLEGANWRRLRHGVYAWAGISEDPQVRLESARLRLPASAVFCGKTAAWLHGLDVTPCDPVEVTLPRGGDGWGRPGVMVHRDGLDDGDVVSRRGFRTTSLPLTLFDVSRRLSTTEAVVIVDLALLAGLIKRTQLRDWIEIRAGRKGVKRGGLCRSLPKSAPNRQWSPV